MMEHGIKKRKPKALIGRLLAHGILYKKIAGEGVEPSTYRI